MILDEPENKTNEVSVTPVITLKEIVRIIVLKPTTEIYPLLNQEKYKYATIFPLLYGIIVGISKSISKVGLHNPAHLIAQSIISIPSMILFTFLFCFIYAWIIKFISNMQQGTASISMIYGLITYALVPMIIGAIFYLIFKLFVYSNDSLLQFFASNYRFFYYSQSIFVLWSIDIRECKSNYNLYVRNLSG
jgi:ABC-type multidrug transport system permease subunit